MAIPEAVLRLGRQDHRKLVVEQSAQRRSTAQAAALCNGYDRIAAWRQRLTQRYERFSPTSATCTRSPCTVASADRGSGLAVTACSG
ncbi:hypothetical protein ACFIOY_34605 [Bradyrhizobium sp. TZ2]